MATLDSDYLRASVGTVLAAGIAETVAEQPDDPVGYLAQFLLKSVADEKAGKQLAVMKKKDAVETENAAKAAAAAAAAASEKEALVKAQNEKEDKRLDNLLESAKSSDEVFGAVLSYARARTGASGYVMLTDLPEKIMPKKEPAPAPAAEGEEPPPEEPPPEETPPPAEEGEPPEPRAPFKPMSVEYVVATSSDEKVLVGKSLPRPPAPSEEDGDDAPPPVTGVGEGVTFTAIDDFISGGPKVFHVPDAVQNRSVKFWYMPRLGAYACAPFADFEGDVSGVLGFDTLGLDFPFTAEQLALFESLALRTGAVLQRIEEGLSDLHHALMDKLTAAYPKGEDGAFPAFAPEEGMDAIEAAKGALALPAAALAQLTASDLAHLVTRRALAPAYLLALKGVLALTSPDMAAELPEATWDGIKEGLEVEGLQLFELFNALGSFDVMEGAGGAGWPAAKQMATALSTAPEDGEGGPPKDALAADASLLLGKVLCDWLLAACALYDKKVEKEEAEAAAAAAAAEAEAPPEEAQE